MKTYLYLLLALHSIAIACLPGCASTPAHNYQAYLDHMPRSILVFPPANNSTEVMAPYIYLSTITHPLAELGYYVFPVAVIDAMMKENGAPLPEDMAQISLKKIREVLNPDAVLYMTVVDWGTKYQIIDSYSVVHVQGRLVDVDTGIVLWSGEKEVRKSSTSGQTGLVGRLVEAAINQVVQSMIDSTREVAAAANNQMFLNSTNGLLLGKYHHQYEADQRKHRAILKQNHSEISDQSSVANRSQL